MITPKRNFQIIIILFTILFSSNLKAQNNLGIGLNLGGGSIGGNLTTQTGFASGLFVEGNPGFSGDLIFV